MTLKNSKRLYEHYLVISKSGKNDFIRKIALENIADILKRRPELIEKKEVQKETIKKSK